eukprot:TRINITY_DN76713_c0_g1_i1.p1 TRINITY_DN76713_c0_g1~~TRINITY_DN76713_c0_g1_i1.p1  ORF type:complete len:474 (+),score=95.81 TRINITY_DN76713_c0_g1_i1:82-1422(+)
MEGKKRHGQGTYTSEGCSWTGVWKNDTLTGDGEYKDDEGTYKGEFQDCSKHGKGTFNWDSGESYVGEFRDDAMEGEGKYTFSNGRVYEGGWKEGQRFGFGVLTLPEGSRYEGEWSADKCHGKGKWIEPTGTYEGTFENGKKQGKGVYTYSDGTTFEGEWNGDKKTKGTLKNSKGEFSVEFGEDGKIVKQEKIQKEEPAPAKAEEKAPAPAPAKAEEKAPAPAEKAAPAKAEPAKTEAAPAPAAAKATTEAPPEVNFMVTEMKQPLEPGKALPAGWRGPIVTALLGADKVGKTALASQFMHSEFSHDYDATVEDRYMIVCELDATYVLDIRDFGGDETFESVRQENLPQCEAFVFCYSPFEKSSWDALKALKKEVDENQSKKGKKAPAVLVATKLDQINKYNRAVSTDEGKALAAEWGVDYFETSSKNDVGVKATFQSVMNQWVKLG